MTTIIIRKNHEGIYRGFYCMGHAEYAKKRLFGKEPDILCAAISVTRTEYDQWRWTRLIGEKMQLTQNEETGFIKCDFENSIPQDKTVFLMDFYGVFTAEAQQTVRGTVFASKNRGGVDHV